MRLSRKLVHSSLLIVHRSGGQTLVEVIVALGVVVALAVSLVTASLVTQRSARSAKNNTQATKLVQQTIEQLRVLRDRQGFSVLANNTYYCVKNTNLDPLSWVLEPQATNCPKNGLVTLNNVDFTPKITISAGANSKQKMITVEVSWMDTSGTQKVTNVTNLSNCVTGNVAC